MLDKIYKLSPQDSRLLYTEDSDIQFIQIRQYENLRWLHSGGEAVQAMMDVDSPYQPIFPINIAMLSALLFYQQPTKLLNLGFGIGCFERFFNACMPDTLITSVESNETIIGLAREYFFIPDEYPVINEKADHFLSHNNVIYSIILCDIFEGEKHPLCLTDNQFYGKAFRSLEEEGVLVVNLLLATELELIAVLLEVRKHFEWVLLLQIPNFGNMILIALKDEPPSSETLEIRATNMSGNLGVDLTDIPNRLTLLPKKKSGIK
ncbi:MAG: hypothetical protein IIB73_07965 [Proteobacteria bacterium]|nr:hypothetical protein [Pseudomonadota bacterium]